MNSFPLFSRFGVELEYMIVAADTLEVRPVADAIIRAETGGFAQDVPRGRLAWSNELALHVIELKTAGPAARLGGLAAAFQADVNYLNNRLARRGLCLLPTAMHPWMNPHRESRLWPHGDREIYETFDRIFDCRGHGWSNLQSVHLNLPFADDAEFAQLHSAIRLLLPLLPALAASSPFADGRAAPNLDQRLETYRHNCARIPAVTGQVIPEPVRNQAEYERKILHPIARAVKPHDPGHVLEAEWTNARGAIARFCRNTIEIRVLDIQECPAADLAILQLVAAVLRRLVDLGVAAPARPPALALLHRQLLDTVRDAGHATVTNRPYLRQLGLTTNGPLTVRQVWRELLDTVGSRRPAWCEPVEIILAEGTLAERLRRAVGSRVTRPKLRAVYRRVAECLRDGVMFHA